MAEFLQEEAPAVIAREIPFVVPPEHAFVDPPAYAEETIGEYAMRRNVTKVDIHIPIDVLPTFFSGLRETIASQRKNSWILYNLHVANTLADFIQKATTMKALKRRGKRGKRGKIRRRGASRRILNL